MTRSLFEYHPILGYRFIPGLKARVDHEDGGYLVRVNNAGFRCEHDVTNEKPKGTARILLFGDSFTAGEAVSNRDRYGDRLEQSLTNVQILNFGLPGTGTDQQYLAYREFADGVDHDLLIIAVQVENIRRVSARYREYFSPTDNSTLFLAKPYFTLTGAGDLELHHVPAPKESLVFDDLPAEDRPYLDRGGNMHALRKMVGALGPAVKNLAQSLLRYQPLPEYDNARGEGWRIMSAVLRKWIAESSRPVLLVPIPLYHYVEQIADPTSYQTRFAEIAAETGVMLHDPLPDFWRVPAAERRALRFATDIHPTPAGHAVLAKSLAPVIARALQR